MIQDLKKCAESRSSVSGTIRGPRLELPVEELLDRVNKERVTPSAGVEERTEFAGEWYEKKAGIESCGIVKLNT